MPQTLENVRLYTHAEAARRIGVSYQSITNWVAREWLPVYQRTEEGRMIFTEEDLLRAAADRDHQIPQ